MKKAIFVCMMLLASVQLFAQSWKTTEFKADELKGTQAYTAYTYNDEKGNSFIYWSNTEKRIRIIDKNGIFNADYNCFFWATIGYYNQEGKLILKKQIGFNTINDGYIIAEHSSKEGRNIINYIRKEKGYIRILAPEYKSINDWEIKIPCINNDKQ